MKNIITNFKLFENNNMNLLFHGTNIKNLEDIKKYGLLPNFGDIVKSTEMYDYYMNDDYINDKDRVDGIIFFSDNKNTWSYSHYGNKANIDEALLVIVENNNTIYKKLDGNIYDYNGNIVDNVNYIDTDKLPFFIENGDYFSLEEQTPIDILYGEKLKKYL